ncbi:MAG: malate:Na+ symporter [Acidobacteriota bacterium]|jgi:CCS family citrate carrier protein|nr:malate:Na+ symporter [Acidobacteriota bacterium]
MAIESTNTASPPLAASASPLAAASLPEKTSTGFWPDGWWRLMEFRIGIVPLPVYLLLVAVLVASVLIGKVSGEISMVLAIMVVGGFTCAEIGKRIPVLRSIGGPAIFATFIPSALVFYHLLPTIVVQPVTDFYKNTNFLYLFITAIIVGSILGMDRQVLIKGFLKIFVPLAAGSVVAAIVGTLVGTALGMGARHTFFFTVVPIMAGGVGEGAIPLSTGYAQILNQDQGEIFAQVLPPVMLGSLTAILLAGLLNFIGKRYPHLTGEGRLQPGEHDKMDPKQEEITGNMDVSHIAAAGVMAISLYLLGVLCYNLTGLPAPVAMLFIAVIVKLARAASPKLQEGAFIVFKFFHTAVVYPLLFLVGVAITPWDKLMAAFHPANIITIVATVASLMATGFVVGRWLKMYPIETAIINATHSGQGGTGDVAILTASNRMMLMPFAQVATRIGGAITVTLTLIVLSRFG